MLAKLFCHKNKNNPPINIVGIPIIIPIIERHSINPKITNSNPTAFLIGLMNIAQINKSKQIKSNI